MTTMLTRDQLATLIGHIAADTIASKDELTQLDADLGDGDLGRTIEWGFTAIQTALAGDAAADPDIGKLLFKLGKAFADSAPSSFGGLFGTALMKGGMALKGKRAASLADLADATQAALDALMERGKAQIGDKTMLDAIHPAIQAMRGVVAEAGEDAGLQAFFSAAAEAAAQGAQATQSLTSKIGRASWQGDRSSGKMDPGAHAIALMLAAAARHAAT
jgi:dihydroxyacetone kinase-like protein